MNIETILHILLYPHGYEDDLVEKARIAGIDYLKEEDRDSKVENILSTPDDEFLNA